MTNVCEISPYFEEESDDNSDDESEGDEESDYEGFLSNPNRLNSLKLDVVTRWYSQQFMLESVTIRGRQQINAALQKYGRDDLCLYRDEFDFITKLCEFFKKFQKITEMLSSETYSTINMACLFRCEMFSVLESDANDRDEIATLKENMRKTFDKRLPMTELVVVLTLLDPRFQNLLDVNDFLREQNTTALELLKKWASECLFLASDPTLTQTSCHAHSPRDKNLSFLEELVKKHSTLSSDRQSLSRDSELSKEIHAVGRAECKIRFDSVILEELLSNADSFEIGTKNIFSWRSDCKYYI